MNGYKHMLRDKMPMMLNLALCWCKAKNRWINYVYDNTVKKYPVEKRSIVVKQMLGIKQRYKRQEIYDCVRYSEFKPVTMEQVNSIPKSELYLSFKDTIDWEKLSLEDPDMYNYWKVVSDWVNWFSTMHIPINDTYDYWKRWKVSDEEMINIISTKYKIDKKLATYLVKSFK